MITFTVRCFCCKKKSDEFKLIYDMKEGTDEGMREAQDALVREDGGWIHVPRITERDVHVCHICASTVMTAIIDHLVYLHRQV